MNKYVILPSTSSLDVYPDNKQSNFTTILEELELDGPDEVALVDICYSANISLNLGKVTISNFLIFMKTIGDRKNS